MNIRKIIKKLLTDTSIYFTVITAIYTLIMMIVNVSDNAVGLEAERLLLIFVFSALAALAQLLLGLKTLHGALRILLHGGILLLALSVLPAPCLDEGRAGTYRTLRIRGSIRDRHGAPCALYLTLQSELRARRAVQRAIQKKSLIKVMPDPFIGEGVPK